MKPETNQYYQECINKVHQFIEANLCHSLYLEDIASAANTSRFHFHRVFKSLTGYSLKNYVIRLRLEKAAAQLITTSKDITTIAFENGFQSLENFSRSFSNHFGVTASDFRAEQKELAEAKYRYYTSNGNHQEVRLPSPVIKTLGNFHLAYIRHTGPYDTVCDTWQRLVKWCYRKWLLGFKVRTIGIVHDNPEITEEDDIRYDACIVVRKEFKPEGEVGYKLLEGGKYAVFQYKGPYKNLNTIYDQIYAVWLKESGYELADKPGFDWYHNSPQRTRPEDLLTDIYVPVK